MTTRSAAEVDQAITADDLAAVGRLRGDGLVETEDDHSWHVVARDHGAIVAATRVTWGGDGLSPRQVAQFQLEPWLAEIPAERIAVRERTVVASGREDAAPLEELLASPSEPLIANEVGIVFSACEPHRLPLSLATGQRPYAPHNINSPESGYLIPLVAFLPDADALRGRGIVATDERGEPILPSCVAEVVAGSGRITNWANTPRMDYLRSVRDALRELEDRRIGAFDGFVADEIRRCLAHSSIIACERGDRLLRAGGIDRNISVILNGIVEVRAGDRIVRTLTTGETFGEIAFLLDRPRSHDVYAATDEVRILSLSDSAIRQMVAAEPTVAAKLLLNVSRMLCARLVRSG